MTIRSERMADDARGGQASPYEPPRVEQVLTPAELEHGILYAGALQTER